MAVSVVEQNLGVQGHDTSLSAASPNIAPPYSIRQLIVSRYHAFWYRLGQGLAWSLGTYCERSSGQSEKLSGIVQERIDRLQQRFGVRFEEHARPLTALKQYDRSLHV